MNIEETYKNKCQTKTDINEHLPTLYEYGKQSKHITEFGVRWGASTWAFLFSKPETLVSYDISKTGPVDGIIRASKEENINFTFVEADTLSISIEQTDLLFIDTLHTYAQLISELNMHHAKVNNHIILHDTSTYGRKDMSYHGPVSPIVYDIAKKYPDKKGLMTAAEDFVEKNSQWHISKIFTNNNGLSILSRK